MRLSERDLFLLVSIADDVRVYDNNNADDAADDDRDVVDDGMDLVPVAAGSVGNYRNERNNLPERKR